MIPASKTRSASSSISCLSLGTHPAWRYRRLPLSPRHLQELHQARHRNRRRPHPHRERPVYVNGEALDEDYVPSDYADARSYSEIKVPANSFFVLATIAPCRMTVATLAPSTNATSTAKAVFGYCRWRSWEGCGEAKMTPHMSLWPTFPLTRGFSGGIPGRLCAGICCRRALEASARRKNGPWIHGAHRSRVMAGVSRRVCRCVLVEICFVGGSRCLVLVGHWNSDRRLDAAPLLLSNPRPLLHRQCQSACRSYRD